jgi:tetratricopeptide (TPR) repeat protein
MATSLLQDPLLREGPCYESRIAPVEQFDRAWRSGSRPRLESFLPPHTPNRTRRDVLAELVKIDLEYCWRGPGHEDVGERERPRLEDYVERYPELGPLERLPLELIGEEYRVRRRWGDRPSREEFAARFAKENTALGMLLDGIEADLSAEQDSRTPSLEARLACPHCRTLCDVSLGGPTHQVVCTTCGGSFAVEAERARPGSDAGRDRPADRLGRYELRERLGRGGFGTVWRALDTQLGREVALKVPRAGGFPSSTASQRFLREARAVAHLRHPRIVAVYDVGEQDDLIYIVSDLVRGQSLDEHLAGGRPSFREAAELAAQVAEALAYAHDRGVVHRDLKPSNIMLETPDAGAHEPFVKLLDFGIAKRDADEITMTLDGQILGTPAYMSPEQIRDPHQVDGRSDIYSLGVVLYQLLTGELPFRGVTRMVLNQAQDEDPLSPRRLNDKVPRDLETIVLQCLAKEPSRRYPCAAALAADLRRWLGGEPILARPVGTVERVYRRCRRSPVVSGLAAGLVVVFLVGFALVAAQWWRAERNLLALRRQTRLAEHNFETARTAIDQNLTRVSESTLLKKDGLQPLRKELLDAALGASQKLLASYPETPATLEDLARAESRVARIAREIGSQLDARTANQESVRLYRKLVAAQPAESRYRKELAFELRNLATLQLTTGLRSEAVASAREALALWEALAATRPETPAYRAEVARSAQRLGDIQWTLGQADEGRRHLQRALKLLKPLADSDPTLPDLRLDLGKTGLALAFYESNAGRLDDGFRLVLEAHDLFARLIADEPGNAAVMNQQARAKRLLSSHYGIQGDMSRKQQFLREAEALREALLAASPSVTEYQNEQVLLLQETAESLRLTGQFAEAVRSARRAKDLAQRLVDIQPGVEAFRMNLASALCVLGYALSDAGNMQSGLEALEQSRKLNEELLRTAPQLVNVPTNLANTLTRQALVQQYLGLSAVALELNARAIAVLEELAPRRPDLIQVKQNLVTTNRSMSVLLWNEGRLEEAVQPTARECEVLRALVRAYPGFAGLKYSLAEATGRLGQLHGFVGRLELARREILESIDLAESSGVPRYLVDHMVACDHATWYGMPGTTAEERDEHVRLAIEALKRAVQHGLKDPALLNKQSALGYIYDREDLQVILRDLRFPADPFQRVHGPSEK